jgi:hypothetical protein
MTVLDEFVRPPSIAGRAGRMRELSWVGVGIRVLASPGESAGRWRN